MLLLGLAGFVVLADNWVVSPILPTIAADIGVNIPIAAQIITAYMIPFALFQLGFGFLADRFGKFRVINLSMLFFTLGSVLCAVASGITDLFIYRALTGLFAAAVMPVSMALIGDLFPLPQRQEALGTFLGMSFLGQGLSTAIGGSIAYFISWRGVFAAYAVLAAGVTLLLFRAGLAIPRVTNPQAKFWEVYSRILQNSSSIKIYVLIFFEGVLLTGSFSYLGAYLQEQFALNNFLIGLVMTAFGVMDITGGRISGRISAGLGRKMTIVIGLAIDLVADVIFVNGGTSLGLIIIAVGLLGLGMLTAHSTFLTIATEFAAEFRGVAMSLVAFSIMMGGGVGTYMGGRIVAAGGLVSVYQTYAAGLVLLIGAVLLNKRY